MDLKQLKRLKSRSLSALEADMENRLRDMRETFKNARVSFDDALEKERTSVSRQPLMALGIALATGVVIGWLLGRKGKDQFLEERVRIRCRP
jgi:ElaB/YqjD/DUF883 family membrane-anchored ribosome-binding protein